MLIKNQIYFNRSGSNLPVFLSNFSSVNTGDFFVATGPPDFLLEEISRNHEVSRIKSIGGAAQVRFASVSSSEAPTRWLIT
jgi:hypothetical protein